MSRCFLSRMDVVGYSSIYRNDPEAVYVIIESIVNRLRSELSGFNNASGMDNGLRFHQMYGDTIDISFEAGDNDEVRFLALVDVTCMIQRELMDAGLMVRGAILCDDLIDNDLVFTGMAMVEAAMLEKEADSPHLFLRQDAIDELEASIKILFPNDGDQKSYMDQTLYEGNKLDFIRHVPWVIPYSFDNGMEKLQACTSLIEDTSISSVSDERGLETSQRMLEGLRRYIQRLK